MISLGLFHWPGWSLPAGTEQLTRVLPASPRLPSSARPPRGSAVRTSNTYTILCIYSVCEECAGSVRLRLGSSFILIMMFYLSRRRAEHALLMPCTLQGIWQWAAQRAVEHNWPSQLINARFGLCSLRAVKYAALYLQTSKVAEPRVRGRQKESGRQRRSQYSAKQRSGVETGWREGKAENAREWEREGEHEGKRFSHFASRRFWHPNEISLLQHN